MIMTHRLPAHVRPERYVLSLKPDFSTFTFSGTEAISLTLTKPTRSVTLHAADLTITSSAYTSTNNRMTGAVRYDSKAEMITVTFPRTLPKGRGILHLAFTGTLNDQMRGFYRSRYMVRGEERWIATTQFEPVDARRAFPCFDEPAHKAVFDVTLVAPPGMRAISNTVEESIEKHPDGSRAFRFAPSPVMSTYLAAFVIGDFEYLEGRTTRGTIVRVHVTHGKKHQATFALDVAVRALDFYERYFGIRFPLPVMDMIAIPDFSHGAMENWGAVTYRETALLIDPEHSSAQSRQRVAKVVAHELAHQWFGNLVTMEWWTHLWLNEGFARYMESVTVHALFPEWGVWEQQIADTSTHALALDSLASTHPIEVAVKHPHEISEIFDEVSYEKGASVIAMLAQYLGEKDFRGGLSRYLSRHAYGNAATEDLWHAFEHVSKKPVSALMKQWTGTPGYPVIKARRDGGVVHLTQSRFFMSPLSKRRAKDTTRWQIPIAFRDGARTNTVLMTRPTMRVPVSNAKLVKLNWGERGFYRVDYNEEWTRALEKEVRARTLPTIDRMALVRDAFALAEAGESGTVEALELATAYAGETEYAVWIEVVAGLTSVRKLLYGSPAYLRFEIYARGLLSKIGEKVGWAPKRGEPHTRTLLRSLILSQLVIFKDKKAIRSAKALGKRTVPPDLRTVAYLAQAEEGGAREHASFLKRYTMETLQEERNRIGRALGQFSDPKLLKKTLDFALTDAVRVQDTAHIVAAVWANPVGKKVAWEWSKKHWPMLEKRYPASTNLLKYLIKPIATFTTAAEADMVERFFKVHQAKGYERTVAQVIEKIRATDLWRRRDSAAIVRFLQGSSD